jgi:hypothetical protein
MSRWRVATAIATIGVMISGVAGALYSTTTNQSDYFSASAITPATSFSATAVTADSAELTWAAPLGYSPTGWSIAQTSPAGTVAGSCALANPASGCSVTGLVAGTTYTWVLTYADGGWQAQTSTSAKPSVVTRSASGAVTLTVPANVTSFTFSLGGGGGGGGASDGQAGGAGGSLAGVVSIPRSPTPTQFTVVVGDGGQAGSETAGGNGGTGCVAGQSGLLVDTSGGGGGGGATCIYPLGTPTSVIVQAGGGGGGDGAAPNSGGSGGGATSAPGVGSISVSVSGSGSSTGAGGPAAEPGEPGSVTFAGNGLTMN